MYIRQSIFQKVILIGFLKQAILHFFYIKNKSDTELSFSEKDLQKKKTFS